jgi:GT2 family glycosyltransferase
VIRVRVGIVSWNTAALLDRCLAALPAATNGLNAEVVLVDNASSDHSVEVARRHAGVTVVANEENVGYARGMNQALTHDAGPTPPEVLIALNPDTVPPPGSLTRLVEDLLGQPEVGLIVPQLLNPDGTLQHSVSPSSWFPCRPDGSGAGWPGGSGLKDARRTTSPRTSTGPSAPST